MNAASVMDAPAPSPGAPLGVELPPGQASRYGVSVGAQRLLLGTDGAVRVLDPPPMYRIPNTHRWFLGVCNVRGTLVPIYDVAAWLELPVPDTGRMLLVVGDGDSAAGVLIDSSPRHLLVNADAPGRSAQPVAEALARHADDTFHIAGEAWTSVDWTALFTDLRTLALVAG